MVSQAELVQHLHVEARREYLRIVADTEKSLGIRLDRLAGVQFTFPEYKKHTDQGQWPYYRRFPALTAKPYWNWSEFPEPGRSILRRLEREYEALYEEARLGLAMSQADFHDNETGYHGLQSNWLSLDLMTETGKPIEGAAEKFPRLLGILNELSSHHFTSKTYFALMKPGVHLQPHCGGQNSYLRMHFAIEIPAGDCGMRVGGIECRWHNGKTLFFDDTFVHEAWNRTQQDRYILLMRVLHPELSSVERAAYFVVDELFMATPVFKHLEELKSRLQGTVD